MENLFYQMFNHIRSGKGIGSCVAKLPIPRQRICVYKPNMKQNGKFNRKGNLKKRYQCKYAQIFAKQRLECYLVAEKWNKTGNLKLLDDYWLNVHLKNRLKNYYPPFQAA